MLKDAALALFGLMFSIALITPTKADAQVVVVAPRPYVYVAPGPVYRPYYYAPYYPGRVWIGGR